MSDLRASGLMAQHIVPVGSTQLEEHRSDSTGSHVVGDVAAPDGEQLESYSSYSRT